MDIPTITPVGEATGFLPAPGNHGRPITVIGAAPIRAGFDAIREFDQRTIDDELAAADTLSNCRQYDPGGV